MFYKTGRWKGENSERTRERKEIVKPLTQRKISFAQSHCYLFMCPPRELQPVCEGTQCAEKCTSIKMTAQKYFKLLAEAFFLLLLINPSISFPLFKFSFFYSDPLKGLLKN